jgi:hypothetical protein
MVVNGLVAVGTLGSVLVALFGSVLREKWWPPVFQVDLLTASGDKTTLTNTKTGTHVDDVRYYHLHVRNNRRWSRATNAGVHVVRIEEPGPDGQLQVKWAGDVPIRCRHQEFYPLKQEIGSPLDYDLCCVTKSHPVLSLLPIIPANNLPFSRAEASEFVASFQVKSTQCDSDIVRIRFSWDGRWEDGETEMQTHLKVKILPKPAGSR